MGWVTLADYYPTESEQNNNVKVIYAKYSDQRFGQRVRTLDGGTQLDVSMQAYQNGKWDTFYSKTFPYANQLPLKVTVYMITADDDYIESSTKEYTSTSDFGTIYYHTVGFTGDGNLDYWYPYRIRIQYYVPTPPSTPSSITVPSTVKVGESFTVSWSSSSGATRYYLERSINGGSYTQVYSGTSRSYSDTALASWNTVSYRVRAYNSDGYSSYKTSATIIIQHFPEFQMRVNGSLKTSDNGWVKVNGVLKEIDSMWVRINGTLKEV
jgi:hypothetical protein